MPNENSYVLFNSNMMLDGVKVDKGISSYEDMRKTFYKSSKNTTLFSYFIKYLDANYIPPDSALGGITMELYRRTPNQNYYDYIGELSDGDYSFKDYNISNDNKYHYLVSASVERQTGDIEYYIYENLTALGEPKYVDINWCTWSICSIEETNTDDVYTVVSDVWLFENNLDSGDILQNLSVTAWDTLGKYGKISVGEKNYNIINIACLLGKVNKVGKNYYTEKNEKNQFPRNVDKSKEWADFCADGKLKLLKDRKGHKWICQIINNPTENMNDIVTNQMSTITFSCQAVMDDEEVSIISIK